MFKQIWENWLPGSKTYAVGLVAVAIGIWLYASHPDQSSQAVEFILLGLAACGLRAGMAQPASEEE